GFSFLSTRVAWLCRVSRSGPGAGGVVREGSEERGTGQARKGAWWMPRRGQAMKDVASCDKPRGAAGGLRSSDVRMGEPGGRSGPSSWGGSLRRPTRGTETSQYPEEKKSSEIP